MAEPFVVRDVPALRRAVSGFRAFGDSVALVPTMGALHRGHLALVAAARARARRVVASIFVNPTQFGPNEDFDRYPRAEADDLAKLAEAGVDAVFAPNVTAMYPPGFATAVTVGPIADDLCGAYRPGHFSGVATVVTKLLGQCGPDAAFFGEKDFQQLHVIRRAARDLDVPVEIVGVPTVREDDGLALSSRNAYLGEAERAVAPLLHRVLTDVAAGARGGRPVAPLLAEGRRRLEEAGFGPVQYLELRDAASLAPVERIDGPARVLAAAYLGRTRLIDNVAV